MTYYVGGEISLNDILYENIKNFVLKDKKKGK